MKTPILYSFRRCPYAMRARMALAYTNTAVELREVVLSKKPMALLNLSAKSTVPVLQLADKTIIDESLDIIFWALNKADKNNWLALNNKDQAMLLIQQNDGDFKTSLDLYKYAQRYPKFSELHYRQKGEVFLKRLDKLLTAQKFLQGNSPTFVDIAIFPFIRQFAGVDKNWFNNSQYKHLIKWLDYWLNSELFKQIMQKHSPWTQGDVPTIVYA